MRHTPIIRLLPLLLAALLAFTGCGNDSNGSSSDADLSAIHREVKALYGEGYYPSLAIDNDTLSRKYGLTREKMDEVIAEEAALSEHPDTFIAVKAKEGEADALEEELAAYRDKAAREYPDSPKAQVAQVMRVGDYLFYLALGPEPAEGPPPPPPWRAPARRSPKGWTLSPPGSSASPSSPLSLFRAPSPRPPAAGFFCPLPPHPSKHPAKGTFSRPFCPSFAPNRFKNGPRCIQMA